MRELTHRQWLFIQEYLRDLNGRAAARRAGYGPGAASSVASRMLRQPHVRGVLDAAMERRAHEARISARGGAAGEGLWGALACQTKKSGPWRWKRVGSSSARMKTSLSVPPSPLLLQASCGYVGETFGTGRFSIMCAPPGLKSSRNWSVATA